MDIKIQPQFNSKTRLLVIPIFEDLYEKSAPNQPQTLKKILALRKKEKGFPAKSGQSLLLVPDKPNLPPRVLLYGLGKSKNFTSTKARNTGAAIAKEIKHLQYAKGAAIWLPEELEKFAQQINEGIILANYNPNLYQTGKNRQALEKKVITEVTYISGKKTLAQTIAKTQAICSGVNYARDLVNGPNNLINPDTLEEEVKKLAKENGYKLTVLNKKQLEKLHMGALLGVNKGSQKEARLVILEYKPKNATNKKPIAIVGKGITFDSGGYNLKPSQAILNMKEDMAGAAAVFGVFKLLKKLNIPKYVIGVAPLTENSIGSNAQAVNDVVTSYSGLTVEVNNTDAEGRLVLADAIAYTVKNYKPEKIIDLATLTGACMVALGDRYAGILSNDKRIVNELLECGKETDELLWHLPIHADYRKRLKGKIADLQNHDPSGLAGASIGAAFIEYFVEKTPWAHLDIAGTAFVKTPKPYDHDSATGYGVRLLANYLEKEVK